MTNYYKVEQTTEQSTTSSTFVDVPGATLTFTPGRAAQIWMIFVSGVCRSSSTSEQSLEMRLTIGGVEHDIWSHQVTDGGAPNGGGFWTFERITGTTAEQTVKVQYRAIAGTAYTDDVRVVAAVAPAGADFQYFESNGMVTDLGSNLVVGTLTFSPSSAGDYFIMGSIKAREFPGGTTSQAWFEGADATLHPDATAGIHHSNARDSWNPATYIWKETLTTGSKSFNIRFTSSLSGAENSDHIYRKMMAFRVDAWDTTNYNLAAAMTTTTGATFVTKNTLTTSAVDVAHDYLSIQCARISGNSTSATARKSGELRIGGSALVRTDHTISRDGSNTQGYHHTIGLVDVRNTNSAVTYDNGFLSPNAIAVECAESAIVVFRYAVPASEQTHQIMM